MKRVVAFLVIMLFVVGTVGYSARYCPYCTRIGFYTQTVTITETYRTPCAHYTYGYDQHTVVYSVYQEMCDSAPDGVTTETWQEVSHTITCRGSNYADCEK